MLDIQSPHPMVDLEWIRMQCGQPDMSVAECMAAQESVGPNILFDTKFYRRTYGDEIPSGMTCLEHFCRQSQDAPRNPNALFSTKQWHETISWSLDNPKDWKAALFRTLGKEAVFSRREMARHVEGQVVVGDEELGKRPVPGQDICLFVHYDKDDAVQQYVLDYLDEFKQRNVSVVFLTNSSRLRPAAQESLRGRVWRVVNSVNHARDFGLYYAGVRLLGKEFTENAVILANDSVVGTLNSLDPLFEAARSGQYDIVGAVDCLLHDWHLQSFYLHCGINLVNSDVWSGFWDAYRPHFDKWCVINSQEFGFSRWMVRHGVKMKAIWEYKDILEAADPDSASEWRKEIVKNGGITNPTVEFWDVMLEKNFPFFKRSIFTTELAAGNMSHLCNVLSDLALRGQRSS
ncbi:rhamnan synthesis F family protein [Paraburkholderia oxyphila]|uniref:rhamnan synthesis F family protein n=1 Tax=Paraburkholderia oxyphila TaxID=614212 RepID=UPI0012ECE0D4|nr:rhamnan synthesis F family protein [Paraburkholderia oxyphila]